MRTGAPVRLRGSMQAIEIVIASNSRSSSRSEPVGTRHSEDASMAFLGPGRLAGRKGRACSRQRAVDRGVPGHAGS